MAAATLALAPVAALAQDVSVNNGLPAGVQAK